MENSLSPRQFPFYGFIGTLLLPISGVMLVLDREPFVTWFYVFAWWSYILIVDAFVFRLRGTSLIKNEDTAFLGLIPLSVFFWLIFEAFNLRLDNWHYVGVPWNKGVRWLGYFLSFGTILPGLFETRDLLDALGLFQKRIFAVTQVTVSVLGIFIVLGIASCVLPLLWPEYFFPLVWGAVFFLLEPILYWTGGPSLLRQWESVGLKEFYLLLASGLVCGGLWELWNYWAGAKWIYDIPYVGYLRLGEMPILGFLGFPPFAVECHVFTQASLFFWSKAKLPYRLAIAVAMTVFILLIFQAIDDHTVWQFQ